MKKAFIQYKSFTVTGAAAGGVIAQGVLAVPKERGPFEVERNGSILVSHSLGQDGTVGQWINPLVLKELGFSVRYEDAASA